MGLIRPLKALLYLVIIYFFMIILSIWCQPLLASTPNPVVIAVIDTGIDVRHTDLHKSIWTNPGEIPENGIDDDRNGFVDDVHGWNFVNNNNTLDDQHGHGSHIAGIISRVAAKHQVSKGQATRTQAAIRVMSLKYYDPHLSGGQNLNNTIAAIRYANSMNVNIINYSAGGRESNSKELDAIKESLAKDILFVAAAGNDGLNSDRRGYYPASYPLSNILAVASLDSKDQLLPSSNFGIKSVDIATLGKDILSSLPKGKRGKMTGTSQATAFVSALAGVLLTKYPGLTHSELMQRINHSGTISPHLQGKTKFKRKLNPQRSIAIQGARIDATGSVTDSGVHQQKNNPINTLIDFNSELQRHLKKISDSELRP